MSHEFDDYVDDYADQHKSSIRLSGEDPEYFAYYKIRALREKAQAWGMTAPNILDFGSGVGNSIPAFRDCFPHADVTLSDVSSESLARARADYGGQEAQIHIQDDGIPVTDGQFDIVFTACVFHHIPHEKHHFWLKELRRVTAPGGRLVIFEHNPWNPLTQHAVRNCPFDANAHLISAPEMAKRLQMAGWKDVKNTYHVFFPAMMSAMRRLEPFLGLLPIGAQYSSAAHAPKA